MNRIADVVAGLSLAFVGTSATIAATINVPGDQPTIAAAINAAVTGDVIKIADGIYFEHSLSPGGKAITIRGGFDVKINGGGSGSVFRFESGETSETVIEDLRIFNGRSDRGGGIFCDNNSNPTIMNCWIHGNRASDKGGGIYIRNSYPYIRDCRFFGNDTFPSGDGGGIACQFSYPTISGCLIYGNSTLHGNGGGIYCDSSSNPDISACSIYGNEAWIDGGGIYCDNSSSPTIRDCFIYQNEAKFGAHGGGIYCRNNSNPTISGCTIRENSATIDPTLGAGGGIYCSGSDPRISGCEIFFNTPDNIVGASADGLREHGPSIITLENSTICGTGEHITGVLIEHRGENHISDCIDEGDLNGDGDVDANDLDSLHASLGICPHDIDHDGDTNVEDLLRFLDGYGATCP